VLDSARIPCDLGHRGRSLRAAKKWFSAHPEADQRLLTHYFHAASNYPLQHGWHAMLMLLVDRSPRTARKVLAVPRSSDLNGRFARLLRFEPQLGAAHAPARSNVSVRSGLTGALNRGPPSSAFSAWPSANYDAGQHPTLEVMLAKQGCSPILSRPTSLQRRDSCTVSPELMLEEEGPMASTVASSPQELHRGYVIRA
jgi:hypothetical protein